MKLKSTIIISLLFFLYWPLTVVVFNSFNNSRFGGPWRGFTTKWYQMLVDNEEIWLAATNSLIIALITAICATFLGLIGAYLWGEHVQTGSGLACVFIAFVLAILEISLSFDNAVVNAMKLEKMSEKWRHRFITWGILIAVFGMRFVFPVAVVAIFAQLND